MRRRGGASGRRAAAAAARSTDATLEWETFKHANPLVVAADLQLQHLLGQYDEMSIGQVETLLELQRALYLRLENVRVALARQQERRAVEAGMAARWEAAKQLAHREPPQWSRPAEPF